MKIFKYRFLKTWLLAVVAISFFAGCENDDIPTTPQDKLDKIITANPDLSIFSAALIKTRLNIFTEGGGPFTIFAPTNAAFASVGIASANDLALIDSNLLVQIITYHIQAGTRSYTEIPQGPNATMSTQGGFTQYASRYAGGSAFINGGKITGSGTPASNGYIYILNKVLVPGFLSATATFAANSNYKLMLQAFTKTAVTITTNPYTIFAVPNNVMISAGYDSTTIANLVAASAGYTTLQSIMRYHLVPQRIFSSDFKPGPLKTVQGTNLTITTGAAVGIKGTNNSSAFTIAGGDILTTTGVIQPINGLLKP